MKYEDKPYSLNSVNFFKSIIKIDFVPMTEVTSWYHKPRYKKGYIIYNKNPLVWLFNRKKRIKEIFDEDMWVYDGEFWDGSTLLLNIYEYAEKYGFLVLDGKLYYKPLVKIETTSKHNDRCLKFNTNQEAQEYISALKEKCKLHKNSLL